MLEEGGVKKERDVKGRMGKEKRGGGRCRIRMGRREGKEVTGGVRTKYATRCRARSQKKVV